MLTAFGSGNFGVREEASNDQDPLNIVIEHLSTLGGKLADYQTRFDDQRTILHDVLGNIGEVIYVQEIEPDNPDASRYSFISGRSLEIIGLSVQELEREPHRWSAAVHPDDKKVRDEMIKKALNGEEVVLAYRIFHIGRSAYRWIEDRVSPKVDPSGLVTRIQGSVRDVTEQQQAVLALEKTSELVTRLITSSDQVFYIVSLDEQDPFKNTFTYLSPHVESVIGYSVEDVRNDSLIWLKAIHPDDLENVKGTTREMFKSRNPGTRVYRMKNRRTGQYVWVEDYVVPILDDKGWIREFYASARDITARRTAELERERLILELSRRHDELMQFSHIVSHNLRSPVASILGLAQLLNSEPSPSELADTTKYILQAAQSMDNLLRDLKIVLSVRATMEEKMQNFLISEIISLVSINLKDEIDESGATINVKIDNQADELTSIKSYVQSTLFNLVGNAIKYRSPHRPLVIDILATKKNGRTVVYVKDNGLGIDLSAHRDRIFTLYGRIHNDREGKGMGLYMTKTQIESLNGTIAVQSEPGIGTVFTITL